MGLDQTVFKTKANVSGVDFEFPRDAHEVQYWRKHPNLQGWMHKLYITKGGKDPDFNVCNLELLKEDIQALRTAVSQLQLPPTTGFFFGNNADDRHYTEDLEFCKNALKLLDEGFKLFYHPNY